MQIGKVVGFATSTVKHASMAGCRLLIVQMISETGQPDGEPILAIDHLGAAKGAKVIMTTDAVQIREMTKSRTSPVRWSVMGLIDE